MRKGKCVCGGRQRGVEELLSYEDGYFFSISLSRELFHRYKRKLPASSRASKNRADNISSALSGLAAIFSG